MPRTGDCRYRHPICGATPITSNEAVSSWRKRSGAAFRLWRHQSSIAPIWTSASGVVRTGRLNAAGAVRRESPMLDEAGPLPRTPRTRRGPRAERGARRPSDRHFRHRPLDRWSSLPAGWSAHRGPVARSRRVLEEGSYRYCTAFIDTRQTLRPEPAESPATSQAVVPTRDDVYFDEAVLLPEMGRILMLRHLMASGWLTLMPAPGLASTSRWLRPWTCRPMNPRG